MSSRFANNRTNRKSSNAENLAPRAKHVPYKAMRLASPDPVRNSSIRRRNRILSGPNHIQHKAKRSKLHRPNVAVTLPTPPTSRAPSVAEMSDIEFAESQPGQSKIRLPRRLRRPVFKRIDPEVLAAVDPATLTNVPAEYVRRGLEALGPNMMKVLSGVKAEPFTTEPFAGLPKELVVLVNDLSAEMPTHMLAIHHASAPTAPRAKVTMFPTHNIVLASHCANLPSLPPSHPATPTLPGSPLSLPVFSFALPHPESYGHLQSFLYQKNAHLFLASLLPRVAPQELLQAAQKKTVLAFAGVLADTFTPQIILRHAKFIHGIYTNMCVLGIQDDRMWYLLNIAWEVILLAAAISSRNSGAQQ